MEYKLPNSRILKEIDFYPGSFLILKYNTKKLILVLVRNKENTLILEFEKINIKIKEKIINIILKENKINIQRNKKIILTEKLAKLLIKSFKTNIKVYKNNKINKRGINIPNNEYFKVIKIKSF